MSSSAETVTKTMVSKMTISGHVLNVSCVKWSADNSIGVLLDKHIYLLSSRSDPKEVSHQFPYRKAIIANPVKSESTYFDVGLDFQDVYNGSDFDEQQVLICDPTLARNTANAQTFCSYRQIEWSPLHQEFGCLLAALTLDSRLFIYRKDCNEFKLLTDLTPVLNKEIKKCWTDADSKPYHKYRDRMYCLATNAFCWSKTWTQKGDSMSSKLFLGSKNGLITIWELTISSDLKTDLQMVHKWQTDYQQINCLKYYDNFLMISSIDGRVDIIFDEFSSDSPPNPLSLWPEVDNIYVNSIAIKRLDDSNYEIVFTKSEFIIISIFSYEKIDHKILLTLKTIKSVPGLHQMPTTAVCPIVGTKYLLTSLDGRHIEIDIAEDLSVTQREVRFECVNSLGMCSHGVDASPNGVLSVLVQSLTPLHDHLVVKEPIQVIVFSNLSFEQLLEILSEKYLSEDSPPTTVPIEDYLDCIRSYFSNCVYTGVDTFLLDQISEQKLNLNSNLFKLKLIRFLIQCFIARSLRNNNNTDNDVLKRVESSAQLCEDLILKTYIQNIYENYSNAVQNLNGSQLLSLKNMNSWLKKRSDLQFKPQIKRGLDTESLQELCPICGQHIVFESRHYGRCPQSHRFDRCVNSLLLCDFLKHKYVKCFRCDRSLVITPPVWGKSSVCLYCL